MAADEPGQILEEEEVEEEEVMVTGPIYWYYLALKILLWLVLQVAA